MKQYITVDQLTELTSKSLHKMEKFMLEQPNYDRNHQLTMSIGQMIEFLDENGHDFSYDWIGRGLSWEGKKGRWGIFCDNDGEASWPNDTHEELCDALWEAVKEVLNKEE